MKLLAAADLHMGRRSSRLPDGVKSEPLLCTRVWSAIVDHAIAEGVDAVLLAGDVVDANNRFYEATGPLETGINRLGKAGIRTVAVAGNHDYNVLPALASRLGDAFTLLGRSGWESTTLTSRDGSDQLRIDGWSFTEQFCLGNPLYQYREENNGDLPVLGMIHCDLDQTASRYAPVRRDDLRSQPVDFWLLGHIHKPALDEVAGRAPILYPGSPQAMDPGEPGRHGAWLIEIDAGRRFTTQLVPLSGVRYETIKVDLTGVGSGEGRDADGAEGEVDRRITDAVEAELQRVIDEGCGPLRYLSCRLELIGRTKLHNYLHRLAGDGRVLDLELRNGDVTAYVEKVTIATHPDRDLAEISLNRDAPGEVARWLLLLAGNSETRTNAVSDDAILGDPATSISDQAGRGDPTSAVDNLLNDAARVVKDIVRAKPYRQLPREVRDAVAEMSEDELRERLSRQGWTLLESLYQSRGGN